MENKAERLMVQIIPAILSIKEEDFERDIKKYNSSQLLEGGWVHIDFMDNLFVPNKSIEVSSVAKFDTPLFKEAHLMVLHPKSWIDPLVKANFKRIIFHFETKDDIFDCANYIKDNGMEVGLAVNPETDLESSKPYLKICDKVLLMAIHPGFQGQKFLPEIYERVKKLIDIRTQGGWKFKIGIDGGVRYTNAKALVESGADFLVCGSYLLKGDTDANLEKIWEEINS